MRRETFILSLVASLVAVIGVFGLGSGGGIRAHTSGLFASPSAQVIGGSVNISVVFFDDENHDPQISLSGGNIWTAASPSGCISGVGTSVVTINDEACDFGTTSGIIGATLTTQCVSEGVVTATSSLHTGTIPNSTSFTCISIRALAEAMDIPP